MPLTPPQLRAWRKARRLSQPELARRLGIGLTTLQDYERGISRDQPPRPRPIPVLVTLACGALAAGIRDFDGGPIVIDTTPEEKTPRRRKKVLT